MSESRMSYRPTLEALEDRTVPSSVARTLGWEVVGEQLTLAEALGQGPVLEPAKVTLTFAEFSGIHDNIGFRISIGHRGGKGTVIPWQSDPILALYTDDAARVASKVYNVLPKSTLDWTGFFHTEGFEVTRVRNKIIISGYYDAAGKPHEIVKPAVTFTYGTPGAPTPAPDIDFKPGKLKESQGAAATPTEKAVAFSFRPDQADGSFAALGDTVVNIKIDGVKVDVSVQAGETYLQVADDVAAALTDRGLEGVHTDGKGDVVFTNDFADLPVRGLSVSGIDGLAVGAGTHRPVA
jgi:hypothetical protein